MTAIRRITLIALTGAAIVLTGPGPAAAQELTVEGGSHCGIVWSEINHEFTGGCLVFGTNVGDIELRALFGIMYVCDSVFAARLDENGEGWISNQTLKAPGTSNPCGVQPCKESNGAADPWPAELTSEATAEITSCVTGAFGIIVNCHFTLEVDAGNHDRLELTTTGGLNHVFCEGDSTNAWLGHWDLITADPGLAVT